MLPGVHSLHATRCTPVPNSVIPRPEQVIPVPNSNIPDIPVQFLTGLMPNMPWFRMSRYSLGCLRFITPLCPVLHLLARMWRLYGLIVGFWPKEEVLRGVIPAKRCKTEVKTQLKAHWSWANWEKQGITARTRSEHCFTLLSRGERYPARDGLSGH